MNTEYKKNEDIPIGGIMVRKNGKKYEVVEGYMCRNCAFEDKSFRFCDSINCGESERSDWTSIIFVRRKDLEEKKEIGI